MSHYLGELIFHSTTMEPCIVWEFPSPSIWDEQVMSHYPNQWWPSLTTHMCHTRGVGGCWWWVAGELIFHSTAMEPCILWEFPSPSIWDPDCRDVIIGKLCIVGAQPKGNNGNQILLRSPQVFPNLIIIFRFTDWKCILQISSWTYTMTIWNHSQFQTIMKCFSLESFCFTWVLDVCMLCLHSSIIVMTDCVCIAICTPTKAALTWSW